MIILKKPIITEKTITDYNNFNKVKFEVALNANKQSATKSLEETFKVSVIDSKVISRLGKKKTDRNSRRVVNKVKSKKFVVFTLKKGDKIDIFNEAAK